MEEEAMRAGDAEAQPPAEISELLDTIQRRDQRARRRSVLLVLVPTVVVAIIVTLAVHQLQNTKAQVQAAVTRGPAAVEVTVRPDRIHLGAVPTGSFRVREVEVTNTGEVALTPTSVSAKGSPVTVVDDHCTGVEVPPGKSCSIGIRFAAKSPGDFQSVVAVRYPGGDGIKTILVDGTVPVPTTTPPPVPTPAPAPPAPNPSSAPTTATVAPVRLDAVPEAIRFDPQAVKTSSEARAVNVVNRGSRAVRLLGVGMAGTAAGDFAVFPGSCTERPLDKAASCSLLVLFRPTAEGQREAVLRIISDGGSPLEVPLSAAGRS
jgi:hypothetical protein